MRIKCQYFYRFLLYLPWLAKEIFLAAFDVSKCVWGLAAISPVLVRVENDLRKNNLGTVIYANSITLTPGTITVEVEENCLLVHALTAEAAIDLEAGRMQTQVVRLFPSS